MVLKKKKKKRFPDWLWCFIQNIAVAGHEFPSVVFYLTNAAFESWEMGCFRCPVQLNALECLSKLKVLVAKWGQFEIP